MEAEGWSEPEKRCSVRLTEPVSKRLAAYFPPVPVCPPGCAHASGLLLTPGLEREGGREGGREQHAFQLLSSLFHWLDER